MNVYSYPRQDLRDLHRVPDFLRASGAEDAGARVNGAPDFQAALREAVCAGAPAASSSFEDALEETASDAASTAAALAASSAAAAAASQPEPLDPATRARLVATLDQREREDFDAATPARQDAYLRWKQHSLAVRQSAEDFAGFFFGFMLKEMRSTVQQGELGHGGKGEQVFRELADEETGKDIASGDRTGLVDILHRGLAGNTPYLGQRARDPYSPEAARQRADDEAAARAAAPAGSLETVA